MEHHHAAQVEKHAPALCGHQHRNHGLHIVLVQLAGLAPKIAVALLVGTQAVQALLQGKGEGLLAGIGLAGFVGFVVVSGGTHAVHALAQGDFALAGEGIHQHGLFLQDAGAALILPQEDAPIYIIEGDAAIRSVDGGGNAPGANADGSVILGNGQLTEFLRNDHIAHHRKKFLSQRPGHPQRPAMQGFHPQTHGNLRLGRRHPQGKGAFHRALSYSHIVGHTQYSFPPRVSN